IVNDFLGVSAGCFPACCYHVCQNLVAVLRVVFAITSGCELQVMVALRIPGNKQPNEKSIRPQAVLADLHVIRREAQLGFFSVELPCSYNEWRSPCLRRLRPRRRNNHVKQGRNRNTRKTDHTEGTHGGPPLWKSL